MLDLNLIFDRTPEDVAATKAILAKLSAGIALTAEEQAAYDDGLRGCYNAADMNRVEDACKQLAEVLNTYLYSTEYTDHPPWEENADMTESDWAGYLTNVENVRAASAVLESTPNVPKGKLTYSGANDIERILYDVNLLIGWMEHSFRPCGSFQCGANASHLPLKRS